MGLLFTKKMGAVGAVHKACARQALRPNAKRRAGVLRGGQNQGRRDYSSTMV